MLISARPQSTALDEKPDKGGDVTPKPITQAEKPKSNILGGEGSETPLKPKLKACQGRKKAISP